MIRQLERYDFVSKDFLDLVDQIGDWSKQIDRPRSVCRIFAS
jgi:hypothetical protein